MVYEKTDLADRNRAALFVSRCMRPVAESHNHDRHGAPRDAVPGADRNSDLVSCNADA